MRLTTVNPCGFIIFFGVFMINYCGPWWSGFSSGKSKGWPIHVLEVSCGSRHKITFNHALISTFFTQEKALIFDVWLLEYNGASEFECDILGLKHDVFSYLRDEIPREISGVQCPLSIMNVLHLWKIWNSPVPSRKVEMTFPII